METIALTVWLFLLVIGTPLYVALGISSSPWSRGEELNLPWKPAAAKDLMRAGNVCTTIVI